MLMNIIVLGDNTSHGGSVISASGSTSSHGKGWARVGDMVSCPRCRGVFPIIEGDQGLTDEGKAVAFHGCKVACGAELISSQSLTTTEPSGGDAAGGPALVSGNTGTIGSELMARYAHEALKDATERFRGRFQVLDAATGQALPNVTFRVDCTGGQILTGATNAEGMTPWVEHDTHQTLAFHLTEQGAA